MCGCGGICTSIGRLCDGRSKGREDSCGQAALEAGEYQQAQQLFSEAVQNGEEAVLAYRGLGLAYMGLAEYAQAEEAFADALDYTDDRMKENRLDLGLYLATAQYRQEKYEDTIETCNEILKAAPDKNADAYFLRGAGYLHHGDQDDAAAILMRQ